MCFKYNNNNNNRHDNVYGAVINSWQIHLFQKLPFQHKSLSASSAFMSTEENKYGILAQLAHLQCEGVSIRVS